MMRDRQPTNFRSVNPMLGVQPRFGPFPAEHLVPWIAIALITYLICQGLLGLGWFWTGLGIAWGTSTWWMLTGDKPWRFLSRFTPTPYWIRGYGYYSSRLQRQEKHHAAKARHTNRAQRSKKAPIGSIRR